MANSIVLRVDQLQYLGPVDLTQYFVESFSLAEGVQTTKGDSAVQVYIVLKRRVLSEILTTYIPTILIIVVSFATTFFDVSGVRFTPSAVTLILSFQPTYFEAAVTVNLTSLLVLATLFIGVSNSLPRTAYVKYIDLW